MKYLKDFELFEGGDPERKAAIRQKIRDLEAKDREKVIKKSEESKKLSDETDPLKAEVITLNIQKLELQKLLARVEKKIAQRYI